MPDDLTRLLGAVDSGDPKAAEDLLPLVYGELRRLATRKLADQRPGQTLQATALVHEAWIRLAGSGGDGGRFANRAHFFKAAATAMQHFLIDQARRRQAAKHGGGREVEPLEESRIAVVAPAEELLAVHEALGELEREAPQAAEIVRLRYFVGLSVPEIAGVLELAPRTVDRHWAYARAWLRRAIHDPGGGP